LLEGGDLGHGASQDRILERRELGRETDQDGFCIWMRFE
jgi:hypothetical protein